MAKNGTAVVENETAGVVDETLLQMTWTGISPLVMHNSRLANPFDEFGRLSKAATHKKGKSEDDLATISRIEFEGGLYWDAEIGPYMPAENIIACLIEGARKIREGKNIASLVSSEMPFTAVQYKGPRDIEGLWNAHAFDRRIVGSQSGNSVLRTRPMFAQWSLNVRLLVDAEIDKAIVIRSAEIAGKRIGLCEDGPPGLRWGRFTVEVT